MAISSSRAVFSTTLLVALVCASCTKTNPLLCCTSAQDCAAVGLSAPKGCEAGKACDHNGCVKSDCNVDSDCPQEHPACQAGLCGDCSETHPCGAVAPVCDLTYRTCSKCADSSACASFAAAPVCEASVGACVQCISSADCSGNTPVCDGGSCRACTRDSECPSLACDSDGSCVPNESAVYLGLTCVAGTCTMEQPCCQLQTALTETTPTRNHVVLLPGYVQSAAAQVPSSTATTIIIHGNGGTLLSAGTSFPPVIYAAPNAQLTVRDLNVSGSQGSPLLQLNGPTTLDHVIVHDGARIFVDAKVVANDLAVLRSTDNTAGIVLGSNGDLTIDRGTIAQGGTGISAPAGSRLSLTNVMIWQTRYLALDIAGTADINFSTIADDGANISTAPCSARLGTSVVNVQSSIIWRPQGCMAGTTADAVSGGQFLNSIVSNLSPPTGTIRVDPQFVNPTLNDYHIQATSPAKDAADTGPPDDFEGDPRPQGPKYDIGADEAPP